MFLEKKINELIDNKKTVNVTLIGAGKFGSMFLSQVPYTKGLNVFTICDLNIDKAKKLVLRLAGAKIKLIILYLLKILKKQLMMMK